MKPRLFLSVLALVLTGAPRFAQRPGTFLPETISLEGFAGTGAESFSQLTGRTLLIEFFAFW